MKRKPKERRRIAGRGRWIFAFCLLAVAAVISGCASAKYLIGPWLFESGETKMMAMERLQTGESDDLPDDKDGTINEKATDLTDNDGKTEREKEKEETSGTDGTSAKEGDDEVAALPEIRYTIQYGRFSARTAAEKEAAHLKNLGISVKIYERDGQFLVTETPFASEQAARAALEQRRETVCEEAFITTVEEKQT